MAPIDKENKTRAKDEGRIIHQVINKINFSFAYEPYYTVTVNSGFIYSEPASSPVQRPSPGRGRVRMAAVEAVIKTNKTLLPYIKK